MVLRHDPRNTPVWLDVRTYAAGLQGFHSEIKRDHLPTEHMAWVYLVIAGVLEVGWAIGLKYTEGFTNPIPSVLTAVGIAASIYLLSVAARTIPIGMAYGVWVGIGAVGTALLGMWLFDEPKSAIRFGFLFLLVVAIVGLKLTGMKGGTP